MHAGHLRRCRLACELYSRALAEALSYVCALGAIRAQATACWRWPLFSKHLSSIVSQILRLRYSNTTYVAEISVLASMAQGAMIDQRNQNVLMLFNVEGRLPQGIHAAAGDIDLLDEAIDEQPVNAEVADAYQETPLHIAATYGRFDIIKYLIREYQVNINPVNWEGWTPLFSAISRGHVEVADFLVRNNANINHTTPSGSTVMHIAAYYNQPESIEFLISKAPSFLRRENNFGCTPISLARPGPIKRLLYNAAEEMHE